MIPEVRSLFPITGRAIYLNNAAVSPPPTPTLEAIQAQLKDVSENGSVNFRSWLKVREQARVALASLLKVRPTQVAFMRNTADAMSCVANGFDWRAGDNIVTFRNEFPSNIYPWLRISQAMDVELRMTEERDGRVAFEDLAKLVDSKTQVIAISHVQFGSGFRSNLERLGQLARKHDALLVVDTIQSLGVVELDAGAQLIDVAAGGCHKWLLTPEGIGYLYLSDRARNRLSPTLVGWVSVPNPEDYFNLEQGWNVDALAWESGTGPAALLYGLETSLRFLIKCGTQQIENYLEELTDYLCQRLDAEKFRLLSSREPNEKSQIVSITARCSGSPMSLYSSLKAQGIITAPRAGGLRISPHLYNSFCDIDRLLDALHSF